MPNTKSQRTNKKFDLEERTLTFSKRVIQLCKKLSRSTINLNLIDQLVRSATSIGANYTEANDALGKKDFVHRVRIARKESKETIYWLKLLQEANATYKQESQKLIQEATELRNILSAIINKST